MQFQSMERFYFRLHPGDATVPHTGNTTLHQEISGMGHHQVITVDRAGALDLLPILSIIQFPKFNPESTNFRWQFQWAKVKEAVLVRGMFQRY